MTKMYVRQVLEKRLVGGQAVQAQIIVHWPGSDLVYVQRGGGGGKCDPLHFGPFVMILNWMEGFFLFLAAAILELMK